MSDEIEDTDEQPRMNTCLNCWVMPKRDEFLVTLHQGRTVEITQTSTIEEQSQTVRIDSWDLPELIRLLEQARRYKVPVPREEKSS